MRRDTCGSWICAVLAVMTLAEPARADALCHTIHHGPAALNWSATIPVPKFDPTTGTLTSVEVLLGQAMTGVQRYENGSAVPVTFTSTFQSLAWLANTDHSIQVSALLAKSFGDSAAAWDGTLDWAGPSGFTRSTSDSGSHTLVLTTVTDMAFFTTSNPTFRVDIYDQSNMTPWHSGGIGDFYLSVSIYLIVCYNYTPTPPLGAPTCLGDGSSGFSACPCGNHSSVGDERGCTNALGVGGQLRAYGLAGVSIDTMNLVATDISGPSLFFQGTNAFGGGSGVAFGDGLLCASGVITRLGVVFPSGGSASYPGSSSPVPLSVAGGVTAGDVRQYQGWYRDSAAFCTASTFNLTQGLAVTWTP